MDLTWIAILWPMDQVSARHYRTWTWVDAHAMLHGVPIDHDRLHRDPARAGVISNGARNCATF